MYSTWWRSSCTSFPVESHCTMYYATTLLCPKSKEALVEITLSPPERNGGIFPSARRCFIASPASHAASARLQNSITVKMSSAYVELQSGTVALSRARGLDLSRFGEMWSLGHSFFERRAGVGGGGGMGGWGRSFVPVPAASTIYNNCTKVLSAGSTRHQRTGWVRSTTQEADRRRVDDTL